MRSIRLDVHRDFMEVAIAEGRYALVEAAWSVVKAPGPLRAFYERTRGRRGAQIAIVATARKLACLFGVCSPAARTTPTDSPRC